MPPFINYLSVITLFIGFPLLILLIIQIKTQSFTGRTRSLQDCNVNTLIVVKWGSKKTYNL